MYTECRHIKTNGLKCKAPSLTGKPYCYFHTRLHNLARVPRSSRDEPINLPVLEDSATIQLTLNQILQGVGSKSLDLRRASLCLYALQIASQHVRRNEIVDPDEVIQTISHTPEGDELGPLIFECEDIEDCNDCPKRYSCESAQGVEPQNETAEAENQATEGLPNHEAAEIGIGDQSEAGKKCAA